MALPERLKYARERAGQTLSQVRDATGIVESSVSDFENGHREPKLSQLQSLAKAYHRSIEFLLSDEALRKEIVLWRERPQEKPEQVEAQFLEYCSHYRNLELWNEEIIEPYLPLAGGDAESYDFGDAEALAKQVRDVLGLGERPGVELLRVLEEICGAKVFHKSFQPSGTAASTRSEEIGLAILLNAEDKRWRRNYDLAHELFHLLTWKVFRKPTDESSAQASDREETLAGVFASCLLLPAETFTATMKRYACVDDVPVDVYFDVARQFDVSVDAVVWRWHNLCRKRAEDVDKTKAVMCEAERLSGLLEQREDTKPGKWPDRYKALAVEALRRGMISTGRFAEYMEISRRAAMDYVAWEAKESEEAQAAVA